MIGGALFFGVYEKTCREIEDKNKNIIWIFLIVPIFMMYSSNFSLLPIIVIVI